MNIPDLYLIYLNYPIITTDSRNIPVNSIFFALKGNNFNGNVYATDAISKGAAFAIIDETEYAIDERYIMVDDVLLCLQQLSRYHRDQLGLPILAITTLRY